MKKNALKKFELKTAAIFIIFFSSFLSAETRIKTIEYNFGGYYNATNLASATQYNFPVRNIKLPENGKTIRSAWLEYEGFTAAATNINPLVIYFDAASAPSTARFTSGQYTAQTRESIVLFARADVTAAIQAQINNLASGVNFAAGIRITGPATNPHTMKLFITYEYDDESPLQVKTVKFPLYSDYTNKIASFLTQQAAATRSMQYLADISETNSFKIQQQWFEIKGYRQDPGSTTDGTIYLNIGGGTNEPTMYLDSGLRDSYYFRYLSSSTVTPGFSTGTVQTVNIVYTLNAINTLGGEVVITYEFSPASPVKTETASLFWGTYLSSGIASSYFFGRPLVLKEEGITIKEIYQRIYGSYDTTTSGNITLQSKIDSTAGASRSYAQIVTQAQISGYEFIHSLNDIKNSWNNGSVIGSTITVPAGAGSHSAELVVTYSYSNGAAHTSNYSVYAGNPTAYNIHPYSYTSNLYWVEAGSSKTLNSAYILSNHISNSSTQDYSVTLSFNGNSPSSAFNKTTVESTLTKRLYENNFQVAIGTTSVTLNNSSSLNLGPFGGHIGINYGYVPPPKNPYSLNQKLPSGTAIGFGQWINSSQVRFEGILSSSMSADTLSLVVEVKPNSSAFDGINLSTGPSFSYSGTPLSAYTIVSGLLSGTVYKWRAAGLGLGNSGNWIDFTAPSFAVDLSSPPAPSMVSINPQNSSSINYQNTALDFEDVTDIDGSGVKNYEIQLATSSDFTTVVFSSIPLASYAYVSSLIEKPYFWRVRVYDNAGNIGSWSALRNFTVDLTTPSITDSQADDTIWRNSNSGIYNVDFSDSGNSLLSKFQVKATSGPNQSGTLIADWTDVIGAINSDSYTVDWSLPLSFWNLLKQDYQNYISVRVYDNAGNFAVLNDVFTVLKDTTSPQITDNQNGDDIWRNSNNGSYNLSFSDLGGSLMKNIEVKITTGPGQSGTLIYDWNNLVSAVNSSLYPGPITIPPGIWNILPDATSYFSFRVYDYAGSTSTLIDAFYIRKDTQNPSVILSVPASTNSLSLTVSASHQDYGYSGIDNFKLYYTYDSAPPYTWLYYGAFSSPSISFLSSQSGFVGFRAVIYDKAGNRDENDPPSSLTAPEVFTDIDLTVPIITDNQNGDDTWRSSGGTLYDVDFSTGGGSSPLMAAQYKVTSQPNQGGSIFKDWTYIASNINYHEYKTNWPVDFNSLDGGINYVSVRVWNTAGTTVTLNDVFYIKKDTVVPSLIDNQTGDYNWKNLDSGTYDIDAADSDSLLNRISVKITTGPGQSGTLISDWETAVGNINLDSYTQNWQIPSNIWSLIPAGTSYVSVRAWDNSGLYSEIGDAFFVLKDTVNPTALDNQSGDDIWRGTVSGNYDIDAFDYGNSLLKSLEIKIMSLPGQSGTQILDWYSLIYMAPWNISSYTDNFSLSSVWDLIPEGTSYVSVKIKDKAENYSVLPDAFYIRKDISGPLINDNQSGDDIWRKDNSAQYSVFFQDNLSGLKAFEVKASSGLNQSGTIYSDWTKVSDLSGNSFNSSWSLPLSVWNSIKEGTAYISVRTSDTVGNISISTDVFYVKKDTTAPSIIDNQNGDYIWRNLNNGTYNISFNDNSSLLDKVQIKITSAPYQSGTLYCDWTDAFININSASYSPFWSLPQTLWDLISGPTAYVSLRVLDKAGNVNSLTDAFFILKDISVPSQITNLSANTSTNEGEIALSFTAPYDNGELGGYSIRYATYPINDSNFDSALEFIQSWIPVSQGQTESGSITGLDGGTLYYIAVKTYDKAGNLSQISNIVSANSGPDQTAPAAINDLNASQGAYEGEVMLSWTSVGDNGLYIGTATAYQVRYRSDVAITNLTLWNSANVYSQNLSPQGPGNTENLTISGLSAGVTYYFSVRAVDEVSNIGNLSNSASAWAQISQGRSGVFVYQSGTNNTPFYKDWIPPNFSSQNTTLATNATPSSNIRHIIVKASPLRKEKMAGILSSDGVLQIQRYDQISDTWTNEWSTTTISAANSAYRGFDIAYEQNSGRCLILYNGTTAGTLHYKIYDGNLWSPTYTLTAGTAYASLWLRLEPRPDSNEILAAFSKATSLEIYAVIWNGSDWVNGQQIRNGVGLTTKQDWDIAWESLSGKALVTYNNNTAGRADTYQWNGSVWSQVTSSYFSFQGGRGIAQWIRLASDPNSNYIGATSVDSLADWNASVWDGSSWSYQATENTNVRNNTNQARTIDAIWEGKSSRLMVMSGQGGITNNVIFATFSVTGGWGRTLAAAQTFGTWSNRVYGFQLENDKDTDALILIGYSAGSDLRSAVWSGTAWTFNPAGTHSTTLSQYAYMPAMIATDRHDVIPPTLIDNQNGDDIWRSGNSGIYNIDAQDSGGSGLRGIQTKIYSGPSQSAAMIEDWTYQVSTSGVNNYFDNWSFLASSWDKMKEGVNYISLRSVDGSSNTSVELMDGFYVKKDTTAPSAPVLSLPANNSYLGNNSVFFDWQDSQDFASGVSSYEFYVSTELSFSSTYYSNIYSASQANVFLNSGQYYWKVRAKDNANLYSSYSSVYSVLVDTVSPQITDNQTGDDIWRNSGGTLYDADFSDNNLLQAVQYAAFSGENLSGQEIIPWTDIIAQPVNLSAYTDNFQVNFSLLSSGTNYISLKAVDKAGNSAILNDVFYVKKDTVAPAIIDNQTGDDIWRNSTGAVYGVFFQDNVSMLDKVRIKITSGPAGSGMLYVNWTDFISNINSPSYLNPWPLSQTLWDLIAEGTSYVSLQVYDKAGNINSAADLFYILKDTTPPSSPSLTYPSDNSYAQSENVFFDWSDSSDLTSGVLGYEIIVSTDIGFGNIVYSYFSTISQSTSSALSEGHYYWKVRANDKAGNYSPYSSAYSVFVDTVSPQIIDNQNGDDTWRNLNNGLYNVSFTDGNMLDKVQVKIMGAPSYGGMLISDWSDVITGINSPSYSSPWQITSTLWNLLPDGTSYVSIRAYDKGGNFSTLADAFYIRKDISGPQIIDNQPGDNTARTSNDGLYDIDFYDAYSQLNKFQIKITTLPNYGGNLVADWTDTVTGINSSSYISNWSLPSSVWTVMPNGYNYVSVRVYDNLGNYSETKDVFYVIKGPSSLEIIDNQSGDNTWRYSNNGVYDVDFNSLSANLNRFEVRVGTLPAYYNSFITDWTQVLSGIDSLTYTMDWALPSSVFDSMISGVTNYVSVRVYDDTNASQRLDDVFYVKKDTVAPYAPSLYSPLNGGAYNSLNIPFDWLDSSDIGSGINSYDIEVSTDINFAVFSSSGNFTLSNANLTVNKEGIYYWRVKAKDNVGMYSSWSSTYSVIIDTTSPQINDGQTGDDIWRSINNWTYNISLSDIGGSLLDKLRVKITTAPSFGGIVISDWTDLYANINAASFGGPISINSSLWDLMREGTNYVSLSVYDKAGNSYQINDAFYIRKDTTAPTAVSLITPANNWASNNFNISFDWSDSSDYSSGINSYDIEVSTDIDFAVFSSSGNFTASNANLTVNKEGIYYWRVKAKDNVGLYSSWSSTYSIIIDTTSPQINDGQTGDDIWRSINNWTYNISLSDIGGSLLDKLRVKITTAPSFGGIVISDWTDLYANINAASFGGPISINSSLWDLMREGTNYVSLSVYDKAGNSYQINDAFYIRKDTTSPSIIDNQSGDDIWRSLDPGAAYDTDFSDYSSAISSASYIVYSQTGQSGDLIKGETQIFNYPLGSYSHSANWRVDFSFLREGINYVSVKAYDRAGNVSVLNDVFYVKKDTSAPVIYDSQNGDDIWRNINIATYAVSFADYGIGISTLAISAYTLPSSAGQQLINYATFYFGSPIPSYSSGWSLTNQMWDLLKQGTNYIKIHAVDGLGNETQVQDVFYIRKDTTSPSSLTLSAFTPSSALDEGKILLTWTAAGDDALLGAASYYTIRYSPSEILEGNFDSASVFVSTLTPKNSGQSESVFIDGLIASVTYYAAIKAVDKAGNTSLISNSPFAYAGLDKTPPSAISDLSASEGDFTGQIKLDWTAVGEGTAGLEGSEAAHSYLVKYTSSVWSGFDAVNISTYTQTWLPLSKGETESRVMEGLLPGATYTIAIKVIDEAGNISPISNVVIGTAASAGAADGLIVYPQSGTSDLKYRTWSPIVWSSQLDTSLNSAASARWIVIKAVPIFANAKIAGVLYSDNSLRIYKYDGLSALWSDITPTPAPVPAASNYRKFDMAVENNTGRIMVAYYNNSAGSISYAVYSATASAWVVGPSSLSLASLTGTINWVKLKSLPGSNKIALAALDSNSDISAAIWNANAWGNNVNLTAAASLATKEVFDISWETLSGDLLAMWGTGTTTNYRKYYSTSTWAASALTGPNPAAAIQWLRLSSDPLSNRIGASYLYGTTSWNAAIWRAAGTETWTASTADTTISQVAARITDCAWQSKTSKFIAVAADEIGTIDNKFKTAVWSDGTWSATPSAGTVNNYTVFAGSISWLSLYPDPNTDNITLLGIDTAFDLKSTVWSGSAWADLSSSANFLHQNNLPDFNYEAASADFDRHDTIPPTAIDNQTGDDIWRNSNSAFYNINATDSGGSKLAGIQTKIRTAPSGGGTLIEDWTYQVSAINSDSYSLSWPFIDDTFNKIPQGQSYVWVRAVDGVGNISNEISDAFYVRKDTTPPQIINNMPSDYFSSWTSTGTGPVNIDFSDSGGSQISSAAWSAYSQSSMGGSLIVQNVLIASGTMGNSYNTGWSPDFSLMAPGTNYISVTVWDNAGSSQTLIDAFKILKDTIAPSAASDFSAQPGPLSGSILITWTAPGDDGNYNNNFQGGYIIKYATYPIVTQSLFDSASSYLSSPIPASAGAQQSAVIYELENETTYYFALRTYDKAYNISSLSPSVSSLPGRNGIFINEIYAAGNSSSDWIEFFNNTNSPISLDGWKIIYKQGALDSAAAEVQIWAGGTSDIVSSSSIYKINPNYDLNSAQSYSLILKNQQNYVIDKVQWPSMGIGESFARVYDGYEFFEIDPTPTPGYKNSISTSDIKINEISYSGYEFIEIYNLGNSTLTLTDYYLRNSNEAPFRFDRKIYPRSYSGIDDTSFSKDNFDYYSSFGLNGLKENGDFLVLEDASGQTLDRLVWQSAANYSFYDYKAVKVSAKNYAAANSLALARLNGEGYDSDLDSYDFSVPASATPFSRNSGAGQSSANTLIFPQDNSVLPANFPIKLSFGEDYSAGANDIIVFIRTSGAQDYQSPHIFRLSDIGFNLSSLSPQTSAYLSSYFSDIDGNKLSDKAYYKVILVSDKNSYSSPQIVKQNIYADFASHPYLSFKSSAAYLNENSKQAVFSFVLRNSASSYDLTLSSAIFYLYDKNSVPLTQTQAENLIKSAAIYSDSSLGEKGKYESEIDSDLAAEKQNYELSVDASGKVIIEISSSAAVSSLSLGSSSTYYLVFNSTDNASIQNPKEILVKLSQILIRDKNNFLFQPLSGFSPLISSTFTFIRPASPPAGTNWPYSAPSPLLVETMADIYNGGLLTNRVYISGKDGIIRTVDYNGNEKWTFADSPSAEIKTAPLIREEGSFVYLYFADSLGNIYKLKDNGASGSQEWKINLSNAVSGNLIDTQDKIYTATSDGKIHCINKIDGNTCSGWTYDLGFNGSISGTLSIDDRPEINTGWIGLENGKVIAFRLSDGLILNQFTTGGPVYASPFVDSAYAYANNNLYIASADGKLYSRNSANLTAFPPYWNDFNAGSPIYSSPFKGIGEDYVYIGDDSGKLYKVSSTSGTLTGGWVYQAPEKIRTIPVALPAPHNKVFFSSGEFLYCLNTADASLCSGYPIHTGGEIKGDIIIDFDNSVLVFSSSGGKTYMIEI